MNSTEAGQPKAGEAVPDAKDEHRHPPTLASPPQPVQEPPTLADVLDALQVFNPPKASEGGDPWTEADAMAVTALPAFIHNVGRAWYAAPPQPVQEPTDEERRALIEADAWIKFAAASERIGQKLSLSKREALDLRNAIDKLSSVLMRDAAPPQPGPSLQWAVDNWNSEVKHRPVVNVHRQFLDSVWRKMMRHFGGDPDTLVGPPLAPLEDAQPVQEPVAWADKIAFESALRAGKGCDVWPNPGDYAQRTGRKLIALYYAPPQPVQEPEIGL